MLLLALLISALPPQSPDAPRSRKYFELGPLTQVQQQIARGDCASAMISLRSLLKESPDTPEVPQARYLLGLCLIEQGEYPEAEQLFAELVTSYPALKDDHLFLRGQALYLWGNRIDAARVLKEVDPRSARGDQAVKLRARALFEAGDFPALRDWLEDKLRDEKRLDNELLYYLGQARYHTHDALTAHAALREVWREAPAEPYAARALGVIARLRVGSRALVAKSDQSAIRDLEADLLRGRPPGQALADLARRLASHHASPSLRAEVAYARGRIAETARRHKEAAQFYEEALSVAPNDMIDLRARAALGQAKVAEWLGQADRALGLYAMVGDRFPDQPAAEDALFTAGEMQLSRRSYEAAQQHFEALLLKNPVTPYRARCLWGLGWIRYRLGKYEEAQRFFGSLIRLDLDPELDAASRYWLARSEAELGHLDNARSLFRDLIARHPLGFYAALAEDQLAETLAASDTGSEPAAREVKSAELPKTLVRVEEHVRLGLLPRARAAIGDAERAIRRGPKRPDENTLRHLARLYDRVGQNVEARRVREEYARLYPHALSKEEQLAAVRRAHPIKYELEIKTAAEEFAISEALLFALVRTESNFMIDATSLASAYGLAQLILPTARAVADRLRVKKPTRATLVQNAKLNLRLGAAYLRELLDKYEGSEPLALAAYNAGPSAVDAWLAYRVRPLEGVGAVGRGVGLMPTPDELVEEIPVSETRGYVKTVLARARSYARLLAASPAPIPEREAAPPLEISAGVEMEPVDIPLPAARLEEPLPGARTVDPFPRADRSRIFSAFAPP
jgi:soluble lytic murein transglycosylase